MPIEQVRVGDRVLTDGPGDRRRRNSGGSSNGDGESDSDDDSDIDPETWCAVELRFEEENGEVRITLLRPTKWLEQRDGRVGRSIPFAMGTSVGLAEVVAIRPCPPITSGPGRVVMATITSVAPELVSVRLVGGKEAFRSSRGHLVYSVDVDGWVSAAALVPGDRLLGLDGEVVVEEVRRVAGATRVFNMEVNRDHRYRVGADGILVHNDSPKSGPEKAGDPKKGRAGDRGNGLPAKGPPGGTLVRDTGHGTGTIRDYDADGNAKTDYDFHDGEAAGNPHAHDWDWSRTPPRGPARPLKPGE